MVACTIYCEAEEALEGWAENWAGFEDRPIVWDCLNNDVATDGFMYTVVDGIRYALFDTKACVAEQMGYTSNVRIRDSVTYKGNTYLVVGLKENAFQTNGVYTLQSIILPTTIQYIGANACYAYDGVTIYYMGSESEFSRITFDEDGDDWLDNTTVYYYVANESDVPNDGGNYWHYAEDGVTPVVWELAE
jgi:hypothetical protein